MTTNTLTLVQEVYFDLCDILDNNELDDRIKGFYEFDSIRDFMVEQKEKIARIEKALDFQDKAAWAPGINTAPIATGQLNKALQRLVLTPGNRLLNKGGFTKMIHYNDTFLDKVIAILSWIALLSFLMLI